MKKPLVLSKMYATEKSWDEWIDQFDSIVTISEWNYQTVAMKFKVKFPTHGYQMLRN